MKLRKLNKAGLAKFEEFLIGDARDGNIAPPQYLLEDPENSCPIPFDIDLGDLADNVNRFSLAEQLYSLITPIREAMDHALERDKDLWSWLSLRWFSDLCPPMKTGIRKPGELARWIPQLDNPRRYYRHLLLGPYLIYKMYADEPARVKAVLCSPIHVATSEVFRTVVETQEFLAAPAVVTLTTQLYYDDSKNKLRRGAGTKEAGGVRRLGDVLAQLQRTIDLHQITASDLLRVLPDEFKKLPGRARAS